MQITTIEQAKADSIAAVERLRKLATERYGERKVVEDAPIPETRRSELKARTWDDYFGQEALKTRLDVSIRAAKSRNRALDHVFLDGNAGCGKSTLAGIIADTMGIPLHEFTMPVKRAVMERFLKQWGSQFGVVLLDEIHRASKSEQEDLLTLLEDGYWSTTRGIRIPVRNMTVVAATTQPEKLDSALLSRFPIRPSTGAVFSAYSPEEMHDIVLNMCDSAGLYEIGENMIPDETICKIATAAGGVPRCARDLVFAASDFLEANDRLPSTDEILTLCHVDENGLTFSHSQYLLCLRQLGGQAGLSLLSSMLRYHPSVINELERLLINIDLITLEDKGRTLTNKGWQYV